MSFLLAEQNTNVALRYADYGYILENGRVVMDGEAAALAANEDVKEFYLGISAARPARASATPSTTGAASAGWPEMSTDDTTTRSRRARPRSASATSDGAPAGAARACAATAPGFARILHGRRSAASRLAARRSRRCRSRASPSSARCRSAQPPFGGLNADAGSRGSRASSCRPGPIYEPEGRGADYWRMARGAVRGGLSRRRRRATTASPTTSRRPAS